MLDNIFDSSQKIFHWFSSKPNRLRLKGARIEVMAFVICREPQLLILLGKSPYHNMWMPPQEGVNLSENHEQALKRCLTVECKLDLPEDPKSFSRLMHIRSYRYMGAVDLPSDRRGERPVADDAIGTAFESVRLKKKAYWMATILIKSKDDISPQPDGKELIDLKWFSFPDAKKLIRETNHPEKATLLLKSFDFCLSDICGGMSPKERRAAKKNSV